LISTKVILVALISAILWDLLTGTWDSEQFFSCVDWRSDWAVVMQWMGRIELQDWKKL